MDDEALDLLLSGDLTKLSPLPKRVVRLFVSSTFTDMILERNSLMERVYPRLKKFCRERHGLDFQVVDMRWGVRDEATDDHQTASLCSREIANCQRVSLGPNFVAFIGDKYGFRPLSNRIRSNEYCALRRSLIELDINTDFLDTWYREDLNAIPAEYVLQPISSILKNFTNKNEPELQSIDQRIWQAIHERLHDLLLIGSRRLVSQGRMGAEEQLLKYSISVTEREVIEGCLNVADAKLRCLVYSRSIVDLENHARAFLNQLNSSILGTSSRQLNAESSAPNSSDQPRRDSVLRKASLKIGVDTINLATSDTQSAAGRRLERNRRLIGRYIDLSVQNNLWQVDEEAQQALSRLKCNGLQSKLNPNGKSLSMFKIHWNEQDGVSSKLEEHKHYLADLSEHFYSNLVKMIRNAVRHEQSRVNTSGLTGEVLQHAHYARHVGQNVLGRGYELAQIRDYVVGCHSEGAGYKVRPMFVYGIGGSGKTALLAQVALLAREWILADQDKRLGQRKESLSGGGTSSDCDDARNQSISWTRQPCIVLRFCCTTPASSSIVGVLTSVCLQLQYNFYQFGPLSGLSSTRAADGVRQPAGDCDQFPFQTIPDDFVRLVFVFRQLIENCRHRLHKNRLFLIVLDSIERLSSSSAESNFDEKYSWLTSLVELPLNVRLVVSCSSEMATSQGSIGDDYTHLKRHFLRVYLNQWRKPDDLVAFAGRSPHRDPHQDNREANARRESECRLSRSASHYDVLRRLLVPAIRLSRGSRRSSLQIPQRAATELQQQRAHSVVGWPCWPRSGSNLPEAPEVEAPRVAQRLDADRDDYSAHLQGGLVSRSSSDELQPWPAIGLLHVHPFGLQMAKSILARWLRDKGRSLTSQQWLIVDRSFGSCSRPIFVKLALGEVLNWKSYSVQANSKGLSFGSSTLEDQVQRKLEAARRLSANEIAAKGDKLDASLTLAKVICDQQADSAGRELEFEWNLLSMEQQWLNFVDHCQQLELRSTEANHEAGGQQNVVFRIGQQIGTGGSKYAALSSTSTTQSATASTIICRLSDSISDAICQLFGRIELQHGYLLTKHSLSYITAARNGIGENELEDLLSLDDVVLDDVFQYHLPPIRRIPPLLWTRIRNDLPGYLNERDADGIVLNWHHHQFNQVARGRYLAERRQLIYIHSLMADYFLGKWADRPKPFECTKQQIQMAAEQLESAVQSSARDSQSRPARASLTGGSRQLGSGSASMNSRSGVSFSVRSRLRSSDQHDQRFQWMQAKADRRVPHQPLYYLVRRGEETHARSHGGESGVSRAGRVQAEDPELERSDDVGRRRRYNLRKLVELPHHLMQSRRFACLAKNVFFNYHWLFASLEALGLQSLFTDIQQALACLESALVEAEDAARLQEASVAPGDSSGQGSARLANKHETDDDDDGTKELDCQSIRNLIEQLNILSGTLRLSASTIHLDKQMLAPQLIARLLPIVMSKPSSDERVANDGRSGSKAIQANEYWLLQDLVAQCDRFGCLDCSLLPVDHCLQPADGLQSSSLEGHAFGIMSMDMTSDHRHLLAASDKFLMWDISTGEIAREIDPKLEGALISRLRMGATNEFAAALTSDNQVLVLDIPTQRVAHYRVPLFNNDHSLCGLQLVDVRTAKRFLAWTETGWFVFRVDTSGGLDSGCASKAPYGLSVRLEYSINLLIELDLAGKRVLEVTVEPLQTRPKVDVAFVLLAEEGTGQLELRTIELLLSPDGSRRGLLVWKQRLTCAKFARAARPMDQLVYADPLGNIYLTRRRKHKWSRGKLLCSSATRMANGTIAAPTSVRPACGPLPLACEAQSSLNTSNTPREVNWQCDPELAEFERAVDCPRQEDELGDRVRVFKGATGEGSAGERTKKPLARDPIAFVKLYFHDRIVVLNLLKGAAGWKCLTLPRDVRNVAIEANKCRLFALLVASRAVHGPDVDEQYLVVADSCNLLVFSVASEQLLRCIAAHSSRITQLSAIKAAHPSRDSASCQLASCSMDKSVRIWNLCNLGRDTRPVDRLSGPVGRICVSKQLPLAACLSTDGHQLGLWNWQTLRLLVKLQVDDLEAQPVAEDSTRPSDQHEAELEPAKCWFIACKFSYDGRHLAVATARAVHLLSTRTCSDDQRKSPKIVVHERPVRDFVLKLENFNCRGETLLANRLHRFECQEKFSVSLVKFLNQGASLLVIFDQSYAESRGLSASSSAVSGLPAATSSETRPANALVLKCFSLQNGVQLVYCLECLTPAPGKHSETELDLAGSAKGRLNGARMVGERERRSARLPVITRDQQSIVVLEYAQRRPAPAAGKDSAGLQGQLCLNIYSTRDGARTKTIILSQVEVADLLLQLASPSSRQTSASNEVSSRLRLNQRSARQRIDLSRATRLKATRYLDRQSVVALADDESESTYLLDVAAGQLVAYSDQWNGRTSFDGRFGLTRILKSAHRASKRGLASSGGAGSSDFSSQLTPDKLGRRISAMQKFAVDDGLQVLEMRKCQPVKSVLTLAAIARAHASHSGAGQRQTAGAVDERELASDFTRPNDLFVYYHELRSKRLLLVRLSDQQLVANYRLPVEATTIKCSSDGFALLLGLADGSLCALAIVDPQTVDSQNRLQQYPSRGQTRTRGT